MDQFGVLVESIGFKAYGKSSAPLADLKTSNQNNNNNNNKSNATTTNSNSNSNGFPQNIGVNQSSNSDFDFDVIFGSNNNNTGNDRKFPNPEFDDVFGGFKGSGSGSGLNNYDDVDDVFGLMKTSSGSASGSGSGSGSGFGGNYDVLGNRVDSPVMQADSVDDLLGGFGGMGVKGGGKKGSGLSFDGLTRNLNANANVMKSSGLKKNVVNKQEVVSEPADLLSGFGVNSSSLNGGLKKNSVKKQEAVSEPADLLSDFGVKTSSLNGRKSEANPSVRSAKSFSASAEDPFVMFETTQGSSHQVNNGASVDDYLDSLFSSGAPSNTRSSQGSTTEDSVYNALFNNNVAPKKQNKASSVSSSNSKQAMPKAKSTDDFSYLFGMGVAPPSGEFQEIEGESEERRKARFNHHMTTQARMNNALYEKNKRDLQAQQEQDEKHRVAATLEGDIKRWAVGKEGNLRALLSSLQHILWAGSGWQPISLTDLITSTAVKKAYYKATLCVHPDKVQQKGASVQQKYIAEKVFDLLKESWNKFNAEEFKKQ